MLSFKQFMSEVLDATQRRKFALKMKKNKTRIAMGRKRAERKICFERSSSEACTSPSKKSDDIENHQRSRQR